MKGVTAILLAALVLLQYRLWIGDGGLRDLWRLEDSVARQTEQNALLAERNQRLDAEVRDLKQGLDAIEERARRDLGMIRRDETFYQIVE